MAKAEPHRKQTTLMVVPQKSLSFKGNMMNQAKGGARPEIKVKELSFTINPTAGANTWFNVPGDCINGLLPGNDYNNRIGRKVVWSKLLLRYHWRLGATSTGGSPCRVLIVYDKQTNAATPLIAEVLSVDGYNGYNNLNSRDRFVTLMDFMTAPISAQGEACVTGIESRKINLETIFNSGTAGTVADINTGGIFMWISQTGGIATAAPEFQCRTRLRYLDA